MKKQTTRKLLAIERQAAEAIALSIEVRKAGDWPSHARAEIIRIAFELGAPWPPRTVDGDLDANLVFWADHLVCQAAASADTETAFEAGLALGKLRERELDVMNRHKGKPGVAKKFLTSFAREIDAGASRNDADKRVRAWCAARGFPVAGQGAIREYLRARRPKPRR